MTFNHPTVLAGKNLCKVYHQKTVLSSCSLAVKSGEAVGLLGPNGAGKTTCFGLFTGLVHPTKGRITLGDVDITALPMYRRGRLGIRYLPQDPSIFRGLSVEDNLMAIIELFIADPSKQNERLEELLEEFNITSLRKNAATHLSGGERRRVEIARALVGNPYFILFDEPLAGIDPKMTQEIRSLIKHLKKKGIGILLTEHNVHETFMLIDRAYVIHEGHVLSTGSPEDLKKDAKVRSVYLGHDF